MCGLPVMAASMGGTAVCPWCDCGWNRDGTQWTWDQFAAIQRRMEARKRNG